MNEKIIDILAYAVTIAFLILMIFGIFQAIIYSINDCCICGVYTNHCCPCPNLDHKTEIVEYFGYEPSSAGSWDYMCRTFMEATNETFDCFE